LSAVTRLQERFGSNYVIDFLRGSRIVREEHQSLKTYGVGRDISKEQWKLYIKDLLYSGYLEQTSGEYPLLKLNDKSRSILKGEEKAVLTRYKKEKKEEVVKTALPLSAHPDLLQLLKDLRYRIARQENVPAYIIFSDATLIELASYLPLNLTDLAKISGFGNLKVGKYGGEFLQVIRDYCSKEKLESKMHSKEQKYKRKAAYEKPTDTKKISLDLFLKGKEVKEIAAIRELAVSTIETHLAHFIRSGQLDIHRLMPKEKIKVIMDEVRLLNGNSTVPVKEKLGDDYSYGEIRAVMSYMEWMQASGIST
jgi:ATP-dependent DNA helicase RecQ